MMKRAIGDYFKKQTEEKEEGASGQGEPMRGPDSDASDDESAGAGAGRERPAVSEVSEDKNYFQPQ